MPRLLDLQAEFVEAIHKPDEPVPARVAPQQDGQIANKRFAVYRNNVYVSLIEALRTQFPTIERLVGEEFFKALAKTYVEGNLPKSPLMFQYGDSFPEFLETFDKVQELPYLADVARIDYARTQSYHAADAEPLTMQDLAALPQEDFAEATFTLHPSKLLISSPYPIFAIWKANNAINEQMPEISLDDGAEDVMVIRPALDVETHLLPTGALNFIKALDEGQNVSIAVETVMSTDHGFNFIETLQQLATAGLFTNYQIQSGA